jgi:5,5'-dehydrodivanillate O-demethylase
MLTPARNEFLTRVGPGTPMGALLRRYWQPIGGASRLAPSLPRVLSRPARRT